MKVARILLLLTLFLSSAWLAGQSKPKLTLDDFFNSVSYPAIAISPDGNSVAIVTERADWDQQIFRHDLWLYRDQLYRDNAQGGSLIQLTQSGHDTDPQWSPDGRWIAFLSERKPPSEKNSDADDDKSKTRDKDEGKDKDRNRNKNKDKDKDDKGEVSQIYLISPTGGEAIQITQGAEEVHAFSWSADSRTLYFATRNPWTKSQKDDYKKKWKDVVQYRTAERGDTIFSLDVAPVLAHQTAAPAKEATDAETDSDVTPGARALANSPLRIDDLITSPDGAKLAFLTNAVNQRQEKFDDVELYALDLTNSSSTQTPRRLTHNQAVETHPRWASDSRHILFTVEIGDVSGPYRDLQPHLYSIDTENPDTEIPNKNPAAKNKSTPWAPDFPGSIDHFAVAADTILASARTGAEVSAYSITQPNQSLHKLNSWPGTYEQISAAKHSPRFAFIYSALQKPAEIYLADSADKLNDARPITTFNKSLSEKDLPQGKPYRWKADDGTTIEGMLIYPPGIDPDSTTPAAKNLPLFTFIHGGPADADGNHFEADWYEWSALAAANGWLVFEPNYRGSTGYGDKFLSQIVPQIVSRPGKDILEGVDALVKAGIADPSRLAVGGYSYGGYMTNWLITQTTRFKAAVTGAGAVEHLANWGNDDTTFDDAYFLGGRPWEAPKQYHDEAAIFQIDKVRTPTHIVAGADDIRVAVLEAYLLEHALYSLGIPNKLLIFPGEGHSLDKNPWHGKIKVREELNWLQKYAAVPARN